MFVSIISLLAAFVFILFTTKLTAHKSDCGLYAPVLSGVYFILCIGVLAAICNFTFIPVMLETMTVGVVVVDVFLAVYACKKGKLKQHISFKKSELISLLAVVALMLAACIVHFGLRLSLIYIDIDSARYLKLAMELRRTHRVSGEFLSPLILSLFIQWIEPFVSPVSMYKGMILAHIFIQVLSAGLFWCLAHKLNRGRYPQIVTVMLTALYVGGFQLYILTYGTFFHWEDGILILMFLIYHLLELQQHQETTRAGLASFLLGIFGLLICYPFFIAITAVLLLPELIIWLRKHAHHLEKKTKWKMTGIVLVVGLIGGHFVRQRSATLSGIFDNLRTEGLAYKEPFLDFVYFVPILIAYSIVLYRRRKEGKQTETYVIWRMNLTALVFMIFWFVLFASGHLSNYYYYRNYYVLWLVSWLMTAHAIGILAEEKQTAMLASYGVLYAIAVVTSVVGINAKLEQINGDMFLEKKTNQTMCPLYAFTSNELIHRADAAVSPKMYELYATVIEDLGGEEVPMLTSYYSVMRSAWYHAITDVDHLNPTYDLRLETLYDMLRVLDENDTTYVLYQKTDKQWKKYQNTILSGLTVVEENDEGAILQLTNGTWKELLNRFTDVPEGQLEIIQYIKQHVFPKNLKILSDKKAANVIPEVYTAYFGENADSLIGELTAKKFLKNLNLLDEAQAEAVIVLKDSDIYLQNQEFWDKQNIVFENEAGMLVGPANATWEESK
ncbi:MAG: hypothetical protein MR016_12085 [Agathobacter sp.]|nr:hypothetical protein [Agathobacter sp.]